MNKIFDFIDHHIDLTFRVMVVVMAVAVLLRVICIEHILEIEVGLTLWGIGLLYFVWATRHE